MENAWRTVVVEKAASLRLRDGTILIDGNEERVLPVGEIRNLIVDSDAVTVSARLLNALTENGATVVFCNRKHIPSSVLSGVTGHSGAAGRIMTQAERRRSRWTCLAL